jgi:ribonuclease BN (tRNA processing enzyme)
MHNSPPPYLNDTLLREFSRMIEASRGTLHTIPFFADPPTVTANEFQVLRRWNSHTPMLHKDCGGGFFLHWGGKGTVIDPGVTFLEIFQNPHPAERLEPHSMSDINLVVVTHDHPDHCEDLSMLLVFLRSYDEWFRRHHGLSGDEPAVKVHLVQSHGVYFRSHTLLENRANRKIVQSCKALPRRKIDIDRDELDLKGEYFLDLDCLLTRHRELLGEHSAFGLRITLFPLGEKKDLVICDSGDTSYDKSLVEQYQKADILLLHVGTMENLDHKKQYHGRNDHLCFYGVTEILKRLSEPLPELVLLTEWGQEFRVQNYRRSFTEFVRQESKYPAPLLPADLGLRICLDTLQVWCRDRSNPAGALVLTPPDQVDLQDYGTRIEYFKR